MGTARYRDDSSRAGLCVQRSAAALLLGGVFSREHAHIHNPELHRLYKKVDQLSDVDQKALLIVLDSLMKRAKVSKVMAEL